MNYHWNWSALLEPVATGEGGTYVGWLVSGFLVTVALTAAAWVVALFLGAVFGVARTLPGRAPRLIGTAYVSVFRNVPLIVQLFAWYFVAPELLPKAAGDWIKEQAPFSQFFAVSVLTLGVYTGSRLCEQVRAGIEALSKGQRAAAASLGLTLPQTYRHVLLPQAWRTIVPPLTSEFLIISKNSAVASTIGLLELSGQARQLVDFTAQPYESFICVTLGYVVLNFMILKLMAWVQKRARVPGFIGS